ncbi:MAG: tol-pal system-associated acyl-CoA thioesterase [Paracoccus sp. (in: a-proteobacteria)]|uniref:tol-pal system-associated acyl-CoA thioesterase n=1 Tax=Paracoccus sp. TaxID=267 RepID=UPI0026E01225|nr:tol-pal system-associated acyl-CoA thioesterase [Paracoccus sp. (in: a-proteobacteria)]MDO5632099.1 tol-pal system-associated acyl-CoA thioesterase [Paracoccus sp. (in: a-proteobacteria)]
MHQFPIRIYYEDTDLAGIVYYANYLKFIERARSEWLRDLGVDQAALKDAGTVFAVRRVEADYLSPARFDDLLTVETRTIQLGGSRIVVGQDVLRDGVPLFRATVTVVCVALNSGRPTRIPAPVAAALFLDEPTS